MIKRYSVKANSLLYAIYICLIVSILCTALLYYSSLYNLLNQFYNTREELFLQNQSSLTYFLNGGEQEEELLDNLTGIASSYETFDYGLLKIGVVKSILAKDTVTSTYFIGDFDRNKIALFIPNYSKSISYSGTVTINGIKKLPSKYINEKYLNNELNVLKTEGLFELSGDKLPELHSNLVNFVTRKEVNFSYLNNIGRINDSLYYNSFLNKTVHLSLPTNSLQNIVMKGNFILYAKDSLMIHKSALLEDVIIKSPKVIIAEDFKGSIQVLATDKIEVQKNVELLYPSALVVYNKSNQKSEIVIDEAAKIFGTVLLFGTPITAIDENKIVAKEKTLIVGDVYSTGKFATRGKVYGSVYSNRIFSETKSGVYENCLIDLEIDVSKRPDFFVSIPIFKPENKYVKNGIFKKLY